MKLRLCWCQSRVSYKIIKFWKKTAYCGVKYGKLGEPRPLGFWTLVHTWCVLLQLWHVRGIFWTILNKMQTITFFLHKFCLRCDFVSHYILWVTDNGVMVTMPRYRFYQCWFNAIFSPMRALPNGKFFRWFNRYLLMLKSHHWSVLFRGTGSFFRWLNRYLRMLKSHYSVLFRGTGKFALPFIIHFPGSKNSSIFIDHIGPTRDACNRHSKKDIFILLVVWHWSAAAICRVKEVRLLCWNMSSTTAKTKPEKYI